MPPKPEPKSEPLPAIEPSPAPDTPPVGAPIINASAPAPMLSLSMSDLESLMVRVMQAARGATEEGADLDKQILLESLRASVAATQQLGEEVKRTVRRSNPNHPNRSVFSFDPRCKLCVAGEVHPETGDLGHPKATLIHDCLFCYMPQKADSLTPVEIELFNAFTESSTARGGSWSATLEYRGSGKARLSVLTPCKTIDDLASTGPTLEAILVELLYGNKAVDPVMAMARIKELEDRIAAMEAAAKPRPSSGQ